MQRVVLDENNRPITLSLGATLVDNGCFFAVWTPDAKGIVVHIYDENEVKLKTAKLLERKGGVWFGFVEGVQAGMCYALEALGTEQPEQGIYNKEGRLLLDPYSKALTRPVIFNEDLYNNHNEAFIPKTIIGKKTFDWDGVSPPMHDREHTIVYETHVKGFSKLNKDIPEAIRGTYLGLAHPKSIEHLKKLGITAVQLMPIAAFMSEPDLEKKGLVNFWGYNPICFMAPDPRYASDPKNAVNEFKTMVRELHRNEISVILDVVFNHTAEGGYGGPVLSFKGLFNRFFYAFEHTQNNSIDYTKYVNVTGCGNSVFVDGRMVLNLVLDSLNYWLHEMHVDGFRFDLCSTVCRENIGHQLYTFNPNCAFLKACFCDDYISKAIMIAEPWDIGTGGYRLGQYPSGWSEQNDKFRDEVRKFWRGDSGLIGDFATRLLGSRDIFVKNYRSINASLNYVSYHDGFTLHDLVTYSYKHNDANGYNNSDGADYNYSFNYGFEGETDDPIVNAKRWQAKRNLIASVILSQGIPHFVYGDEVSRTQKGNNNAYCQDNEMSYMSWNFSQENQDFIDFISHLIKIRKSSKMLRELNLEDDGFHVTFHTYFAYWFKSNGDEMTVTDWQSKTQDAIMLYVGVTDYTNDVWCLIINRSENNIYCQLPILSAKKVWRAVVDTSEKTGIPLRFSNKTGLESICAANSIKVLQAIDETDISRSGFYSDDPEIKRVECYNEVEVKDYTHNTSCRVNYPIKPTKLDTIANLLKIKK